MASSQDKKNYGAIDGEARSFMSEFGAFIAQGNIVDLAVAVILGAAFTAIINSFVDDILSPFISLFMGGSLSNFYYILKCPTGSLLCSHVTWPTPDLARAAGATTVNYGLFGENVLNFFIKGLFLFITIKKVFESYIERKNQSSA